MADGRDLRGKAAHRHQKDNYAGVKNGTFRFSFFIPKSFFILHLAIIASCTLNSQAQKHIDGKASYYSNKLHGRRMSSGKIYHRDSLTCAHKTLPFGTKLKVTNPTNGKEVIVEVADRGPYSHSRVIDLSYAAARELDIIAHGVKYVKIEILPKSTDATTPYQPTGDLFSMLETEYGMAGVCYEFIPEWEAGENITQKEKNATTKSDAAKHTNTPQTSKPVNGNVSRQQDSQHKNTQNNNSHKDFPSQQKEKEPAKKGQDSNSWLDFFNKLKNWSGNLFE